MKASSASNRRAPSAGAAATSAAAGTPFTGLRFRVAIEGIRGAGAVEVVLPAARIVERPRKRRAVQFEVLVIRRGLTRSTDWYQWWDEARHSKRARRRVQIALLDAGGTDALRWNFTGCVPIGYALSPLNALAGAAMIESLELRVGGFELERPVAA